MKKITVDEIYVSNSIISTTSPTSGGIAKPVMHSPNPFSNIRSGD